MASGAPQQRTSAAALIYFLPCNKYGILITCIPQVFLLAVCKYLNDVLEMNTNTEPTLAPPGAGLPAVELFIARLLFRLQHWRGNRDSFNAHFTQERETIQRLVKSRDATAAATRVLIKR